MSADPGSTSTQHATLLHPTLSQGTVKEQALLFLGAPGLLFQTRLRPTLTNPLSEGDLVCLSKPVPLADQPTQSSQLYYRQIASSNS